MKKVLKADGSPELLRTFKIIRKCSTNLEMAIWPMAFHFVGKSPNFGRMPTSEKMVQIVQSILCCPEELRLLKDSRYQEVVLVRKHSPGNGQLSSGGIAVQAMEDDQVRCGQVRA